MTFSDALKYPRDKFFNDINIQLKYKTWKKFLKI